MPTRTYARKNDPTGNPADPSKGSPSFLSGVTTALPGRTWRSQADEAGVTLHIDGGALTGQEDTDLTAAHTAWVPIDTRKYVSLYKVETSLNGRLLKVEWFETDNGDGTYSGLARNDVYAWTGSKLTSKTSTQYYRNGDPITESIRVESYFTTDTGDRVTKEAT